MKNSIGALFALAIMLASGLSFARGDGDAIRDGRPSSRQNGADSPAAGSTNDPRRGCLVCAREQYVTGQALMDRAVRSFVDSGNAQRGTSSVSSGDGQQGRAGL